MPDIRVTIDCDGKYCGKCPHRFGVSYSLCSIFDDEDGNPTLLSRVLKQSHDLTPYELIKRCQQCLEAEINET